MVTSSLSERRGAGPGRSKTCWIMADPFIVSSTMVKMVVRTVALSSIDSTLLVCLCSLQTEVYYRSPSLSVTRTKRMSIAWKLSHPPQICPASVPGNFYADGSRRTALGEMMQYLGVSRLQELSHFIHDNRRG